MDTTYVDIYLRTVFEYAHEASHTAAHVSFAYTSKV